MAITSDTAQTDKLALDGGPPAVQHPIPAMYPGGMRIDREEEEAVLEVLRSKRLFRYYGPNPGPSKVDQLEEAFARHMGTEYALAVASGTTALTSALAALGVGPGDEVIVPGYTWISTAAAPLAVGGVPIIAEVDDSLTLDPADFERKITERTKVVIPVHLRGTPCDMDAIMEIARQHNIAVLEDAAQADGGSYKGRRLGSIGDIGIFSLQFNKILTAGEGGMVITNDRVLYERALMYHDVAASGERGDELQTADRFTGINCRLSEIQAAVMLAQLDRLDPILDDMRRSKAAIAAHVEDLARSRGIEPRRVNDAEGDAAISLVFFGKDVEQAEYISRALQAEGAEADVLFRPDSHDYHVYYHWDPILEKRSWAPTTPWSWIEGEVQYSKDMCPRTLDFLGRAVHLDISPDLTEQNVQEISAALTKVFNALPEAQ